MKITDRTYDPRTLSKTESRIVRWLGHFPDGALTGEIAILCELPRAEALAALESLEGCKIVARSESDWILIATPDGTAI